MKLRNKKTGDIGNLVPTKDMEIFRVVDDEWNLIAEYDTLAKLNEEWEDYEEDKWLISCGDGRYIEPEYAGFTKEILERVDELGLLFDTKEEAEKAVEKLKAWKRLRDKGVRFKEWFWDENYGTCIIIGDSECSYVDDSDEQNKKDLDLLFGGEE